MNRRDFLAQGAGTLLLPLFPRGSFALDAARHQASLLVRIPAQVKANASLLAEVIATGTGYLASDLRSATSVVQLSPASGGGPPQVDLGVVKTPGVFFVSLTVGGAEYEAQLLILPSAAGSFDVQPLAFPLKPVAAPVLAPLQQGFKVLQAELTADRVLAAFKAAGYDAVTMNLPGTVATGTVFLVGMVLVAAPVSGVAGLTAYGLSIVRTFVVAGGKQYTVDLGLTVYEKLVDQLKKEGKLSPQQADPLLKVGAAAGAVITLNDLRLGVDSASKVAEAFRLGGYLEKAVPASSNATAAAMIYGSGNALTSKASALIRIVK